MNVTARMEGFKKILAYAKMEEKPHQLQGVKWCLENELNPTSIGERRIRGGFIADEMGLGKTITMIGTIFCNFKPPTLIVVPLSLIGQWYNEIFRTTGHKALIYYGKNKASITKEQLEKSPIVLTTYSTATTTFEKGGAKHSNANSEKGGAKQTSSTFEKGGVKQTSSTFEKGGAKPYPEVVKPFTNEPFSKVEWYRVIFDEAHHLRNRKTLRFLAARMLKTKIRWLVSGTPVQNKKDDFYALCSLLRIPASVYAEPKNILFISQKFVLRRTKREAGICLPDIVYENTIVPWSGSIEERFVANIHTHLSFSGARLARGETPISFKNYDVIQLLIRAKQSCILPNMVVKSLGDDFVDIPTTSKMDAVVETILRRKTNGNGKLVFCHYKQEIDTLIQRLREGGIKRVASIDGRNTMASRARLLSEKHDVLVLQIQTGCEGLNLQENYNEIYCVTPHWNPSVEDQAVARCHRIGQTKPVYVFRFEMDSFLPPFPKVEPNLPHFVSKVPGISFDNYVSFVQEKKREIAREFM
jgi:SNF2 family DNA or RNA helicase